MSPPPFSPTVCSHRDNKGAVAWVQAPWLLRGGSGRARLGPLSGDGRVGLLGVPRWSSDSQVPTSPFPCVPPGGPKSSEILLFCRIFVFFHLPPTPCPLWMESPGHCIPAREPTPNAPPVSGPLFPGQLGPHLWGFGLRNSVPLKMAQLGTPHQNINPPSNPGVTGCPGGPKTSSHAASQGGALEDWALAWC